MKNLIRENDESLKINRKLVYLLLLIFGVVFLFYVTCHDKYKIVLVERESPRLTMIHKPVTEQTSTTKSVVKPLSVMSCYYEEGNRLRELEDGECSSGNCIFFHETSCHHIDGQLTLGVKQSCAVESTAKTNPNRDVFLLISSSIKNLSDVFLKQLVTYKNVKVRHIDIFRYLSETPIEEMHKSGSMMNAKNPVTDFSDMLRLVTLYKYGGTYLDMDFIIMKSLDDVFNFAGAESSGTIASGALDFRLDDVGREVARDTVNELAKNTGWNVWGNNGPLLIKRVLNKRCGTESVSEMTFEKCQNFTVLKPNLFYPVYYPSWRNFFDVGKTEEVVKSAKDSYGIHIWNKLSHDSKIFRERDTAYVRFMKQFCPKTFSVTPEIF